MSSLRFCGTFAHRLNPLLRGIQLQNKTALHSGTNLLAVQIAKHGKNNIIRRTAQKQQYRNHKNFGHKPVPDSLFSKLWLTFLVTGSIACFVDWAW